MDTQELMGADYIKPAPAKKDHTRRALDILAHIIIFDGNLSNADALAMHKRATSLLNSIDKSIVADKKAELKKYLKDAY